MKFRRIVAAALVVCVLSALTATALADVPSDVYREQIEKYHITDLAPTHWAAGAITKLYEAGITAGDPEGTFRPSADTKMNEGVAVIARVLGIATKAESLEVTMQRAVAAGFVTSTQAAGSENAMSRLDMAVILAKALNISPKANVTAANFPFKDASSIPQEYWGTLAALYDKGIFKGYPDGAFDASGTLNRAELATLIFRILGQVAH